MLLILRLFLISEILKVKKNMHLGIDKIQFTDGRWLHFAMELMSLWNTACEPGSLVSNCLPAAWTLSAIPVTAWGDGGLR